MPKSVNRIQKSGTHRVVSRLQGSALPPMSVSRIRAVNSRSALNGTPSSPGSGSLKSLGSLYPRARRSMSKGRFKPPVGTTGTAARRRTGRRLLPVTSYS